MNFIFRLVLVFSIVFSPWVSSFEVDTKALKENLGQVKLDKGQVNQMLDMLVAQGKITADQRDQAKKELKGMSDEQMQELTQKAVDHVQNASENDAQDLDGYLEGLNP